MTTYVKVDGWPEMKVTERYVSHKEMRDRCAPHAPPFMSPDTCMTFNLSRKTCDIWITNEFPTPEFMLERERKLCAGMSPSGSTYMADILKRHKAAGK